MTELLAILGTEKGIAFGLLIVFVFVSGWLGKALLKEKDARRSDATDMLTRVLDEGAKHRAVIEALTLALRAQG